MGGGVTTLSRACVECAAPAAASSTLCEPHLRGHTLFVLDRARWPRLRLSDGRQVAGDDAWRPWLRQANGPQLQDVLDRLGANRTTGAGPFVQGAGLQGARASNTHTVAKQPRGVC